MNLNHYVQRELIHLETVLRRPATQPFSPEYWLDRLGDLVGMASLPDHVLRLERLKRRIKSAKTVRLAA